MFDTTMAIVRRKLNGRGIGEADRQHFHHCLRDLGLSTRQSVLVIAGLCAMMGVSVLISGVWRYEVVALGLCGAVLSLLVFGKVFGSYEFDLFVQNLHTISKLMRDWVGLLGQGNLMTRVRMGVTENPMDTWELLISRIQASNGRQISFRCVDRSHDPVGNELLRLHWGAETVPEGEPHWKLICRVPRGNKLQTEIQVFGDHADNSQRLHLDGLHQMIQCFCEKWPLESIGQMNSRHPAHAVPLAPSAGLAGLRQVSMMDDSNSEMHVG